MPRKYTQTEQKLNWIIYGNMPQSEYEQGYEQGYEQEHGQEYEQEYGAYEMPFYTEELANAFEEIYNSGAFGDFNLFDLIANMS